MGIEAGVGRISLEGADSDVAVDRRGRKLTCSLYVDVEGKGSDQSPRFRRFTHVGLH